MKLTINYQACPTRVIVTPTDLVDRVIKFYDQPWHSCVFVKFEIVEGTVKDTQAIIPFECQEYDKKLISDEMFKLFLLEERCALLNEKRIHDTDDFFLVDYTLNKYVLNLSRGTELAYFSIFPPNIVCQKLGHMVGDKCPVKFADGTNLHSLAMAQAYASRYLICPEEGPDFVTEFGAEFFLNLLVDDYGRLPPDTSTIMVSNYFVPTKKGTAYKPENLQSLMNLFTGVKDNDLPQDV